MSNSNSIAAEVARGNTMDAINRVEEEIREGVDKVADMGAKADKNLRKQTARVKAKTHRFSKGIANKTRVLEKDLTDFVKRKPLVVVGGAVVLGFIIGALSRGR